VNEFSSAKGLSYLYYFLIGVLSLDILQSKSITSSPLYQKDFLLTEVSVQYLSNERYNYGAIDDRTFIVVEWNNRFKEEPISGKE
jgi:hypothetical protein